MEKKDKKSNKNRIMLILRFLTPILVSFITSYITVLILKWNKQLKMKWLLRVL